MVRLSNHRGEPVEPGFAIVSESRHSPHFSVDRRWAILPLALLLAVLMACSGPGSKADNPGDQLQVRGRIIEVVERNVTELELLRIADAEGKEYSFVTDGFIGFTPAHLKLHQLC